MGNGYAISYIYSRGFGYGYFYGYGDGYDFIRYGCAPAIVLSGVKLEEVVLNAVLV